MIDSGIDVLARDNNLGVTMRGINKIQFVPLRQGTVERYEGM